ncbi:MAG: conjugal transfer protein TrbC, partial [Asticcacaulis sp. 32-58-5]
MYKSFSNMDRARYALPLALGLALALSTSGALAAGSGMPWEAPLQQILDSVQG